MKAIVALRHGGPEVLVLDEVPRPHPGPGEVLVRVAAAGVNPVDWKIRSGLFGPAMPGGFPWIPGCEIAGTVVECGPGATRFSRGEAVLGLLDPREGGASAEFVAAAEDALASMPASVPFETAAGLAVAGLTAWQGLVTLGGLLERAHEGRRIAVIGAAGGVGHLAVQIARDAGWRVTAVARPQNEAFVRALGASDFVDRLTRDVGALGVRYDVIFDAVAARSLWQLRRAIAPGGCYITTNPRATRSRALPVAERRGTRARFVNLQPVAAELDELVARLADGRLAVTIEHAYPLAELGAAQARSEEALVRGKLVVVP